MGDGDTSTAPMVSKLRCKEKEQLKVISGIRAMRKKLEECCRSLEELWKQMFTLKKTYVPAAG